MNSYILFKKFLGSSYNFSVFLNYEFWSETISRKEDTKMDTVIVNEIVYDKKLYLLIDFSFSVGQF